MQLMFNEKWKQIILEIFTENLGHSLVYKSIVVAISYSQKMKSWDYPKPEKTCKCN